MSYHRDGNMIVDRNGTVVCLMCQSDSFGELHTAHNADANAEVILKAFNDAATSFMIGPNTMERVFKAAGLTDMSNLQAVMDAVEKALTIKPLEWDRGKIFLTAKSVDGAVFTIRKDAPFRLATWSTIGDVKYLGDHPSPEAAKETAQTLHNEAVAKYLTD